MEGRQGRGLGKLAFGGVDRSGDSRSYSEAFESIIQHFFVLIFSFSLSDNVVALH